MLDHDSALDLLRAHGQEHVLAFWDQLDAAGREALLAQVGEIDFDALETTRSLLASRLAGAAPAAADAAAPMEPAPVAELAGDDLAKARAAGEAELRAGRVGAIVVAGGQGSRLGFDGPKGCYPVGPVTDAPLFRFHARKLLALAREYGKPVPFYVMTSKTNDAATRAFFEENAYFGLPRGDVFFFTQAMWPALDPDGKIVLDAPGHVFLGPDGHGGMLAALDRSGALADMERRGVASVFYFQVDNPMVEVADPAFVGWHVSQGADVSIKVCAKRDPQEGLGVVVERGGRTEIVEYTEFTDEQKNERLPDGELRWKYGSVAIHVFSRAFLGREAAAGLPLHVAHKKVPHVDAHGKTVKPAAPNAYKFEKFIFDCLADAKTVCNVAFDREEEFSPVKNAEGSDSPATCRADLSRKWARWLRAAGVEVPLDGRGYPLHKIEIDPAFAHDAASLAARFAAGAPRPAADGDILLEEPAPDAPPPAPDAAEELARLKDRLLRLQADFDNYRKRQARDRADWIRQANADLIEALLPVLDQTDQALAALADKASDEAAKPWLDGFEIVRKSFLQALEKFGAKPLEDPVGKPLDPTKAEAVSTLATGKAEPGAVVFQIRRGYELGGKVLRAAQVVVEADPDAAAPAPAAEPAKE